MNIENKISLSLNIEQWRVDNALKLMSEGATIPFISRYRKEATGVLDEVQLGEIKKLFDKFTELEKRRKFVIDTITESGSMTNELHIRLLEVTDMEVLEDLYLPYKPKRRTRATIAREAGLEPLAKYLMNHSEREIDSYAHKFINDSIDSTTKAINGAEDIVAEWVSENSTIRAIVRDTFHREAIVSSRAVKSKMSAQSKFSGYYEFDEALKRIAPNRLLALFRGENEGELSLKFNIDTDKICQRLESFYSKTTLLNTYKSAAIIDSYKRLISPSIETEIRGIYKSKADDSAIKIFSENLKQLLLASPLGEKSVLALDPGFRTGCKLVCLDSNGNLVHNETIYPHEPKNEWAMAQKKISRLVETYKIQAIAIGDGTAGRETEKLIKSIHFNTNIEVYVVSEDGASIYSASSVAREEFPDYDVTVRGAVSIGRRLIDPLAELVKIDPKSLGVGEYQHDVEQSKLKSELDFVVESCVNRVGVNLNTASYHILTYISGIGATLAKNITSYRAENGDFNSRAELLNVPRLGKKVFEQAAGFLRIKNGSEPLDASSLHPENYALVRKIAKDLSVDCKELIGNKTLLENIDINKYIDKKVGEITLRDIIKELEKPSLDPRTKAKAFEFAEDVSSLSDLTVGRVLEGIVTNITSFGAFVDIGIKQDGLVHISQMCDKFISSPTEVVKLHQVVKVKVLEIDSERKRLSLSMKGV